jgi:hypothetical protein
LDDSTASGTIEPAFHHTGAQRTERQEAQNENEIKPKTKHKQHTVVAEESMN